MQAPRRVRSSHRSRATALPCVVWLYRRDSKFISGACILNRCRHAEGSDSVRWDIARPVELVEPFLVVPALRQFAGDVFPLKPAADMEVRLSNAVCGGYICSGYPELLEKKWKVFDCGGSPLDSIYAAPLAMHFLDTPVSRATHLDSTGGRASVRARTSTRGYHRRRDQSWRPRGRRR